MQNGLPVERVLVSVITFRRPKELRRMLESLCAMSSVTSRRVVVVDNDPQRSAETVLRDFQSHGFEYHSEPRAGIAAARNRCIQTLRDEDALIFLDDDEVVAHDWLDQLVECANSQGLDVVAGPVISILPESAPAWLRDGDFFQRRVRKTGDRRGLPATNNVLVRSDVFTRHPEIRFDEEFSVTGGSDTDFFSRLKLQGVAMAWCESARVNEFVQLDRISLRWLVRRYVRGGETTARIKMRQTPRWRIMITGLVYITAGLASAPVSLLAPTFRGRNLIAISRGLGMIRGALGLRVKEYRRIDA